MRLTCRTSFAASVKVCRDSTFGSTERRNNFTRNVAGWSPVEERQIHSSQILLVLADAGDIDCRRAQIHFSADSRRIRRKQTAIDRKLRMSLRDYVAARAPAITGVSESLNLRVEHHARRGQNLYEAYVACRCIRAPSQPRSVQNCRSLGQDRRRTRQATSRLEVVCRSPRPATSDPNRRGRVPPRVCYGNSHPTLRECHPNICSCRGECP